MDRTFAHVYSVESSAILQHGTAAACAAVWLAVGLIAVGSRRGRMAFTNIWVAAYVLLLAGGAGLGATVAASTWPAVAQQFVLLVAGSLAATAAVSDLQSTVKGQDRYAFTLRLALTTTQADMERERERLDERLHDLRNAVAAMRTADLTLRRHASRIEPETQERLADALSAELSRLQTLIEPGRRTKIERFCLADAVTPVVMTERTWGSVIEVDFPPVTVIGDRDALSQVLQNLLTNARTYALGSPIALTTHKTGDRVQLRISDRGPGVPAAERDLVFDRGRRGSTSRGTHGSGIGLHVASRLMTEMGGRLTLDDTDCGATFVVEVPAAMVPTLRDAAPGWHLAEAVPDRGR